MEGVRAMRRVGAWVTQRAEAFLDTAVQAKQKAEVEREGERGVAKDLGSVDWPDEEVGWPVDGGEETPEAVGLGWVDWLEDEDAVTAEWVVEMDLSKAAGLD
jgi:hypothetical protein